MNIKNWLFPLFFCLVLFVHQIFSAYLSLRGMAVSSGMLQKIITPIALISYVILFYNYRYFFNNRHSKPIIIWLIIIIIMYFGTSMIHGTPPPNNVSALLYLGSICFAAAISGIYLNKNNYFERIDKLLPFFVIPISLVFGVAGFVASQAADYGLLVGEENPLDYQGVSYTQSEFYGICLYYLFFSTIKGTRFHRLTKLPMFGIMIFSALSCIISGGRGGAVLFVVYNLFFIYLFVKTGRLSFVKLLSLAVVVGVIFIFFSIQLGILESAGFERITTRMTEDEERLFLYRKAWDSITSSFFIGSGFGSIWWEVGLYSHNMLLDLLVEIGLIGTVVVLLIIYKSLRFLYRSIYIYPFSIFILVVFIKTLVNDAFSGYWLNSEFIWLAFGYSFTLKNRSLPHIA